MDWNLCSPRMFILSFEKSNLEIARFRERRKSNSGTLQLTIFTSNWAFCEPKCMGITTVLLLSYTCPSTYLWVATC